jgi:VCBS repeat-containing protein
VNYNGPDSFTYQANDGTENSAPATVSITVTPVDDAPVARPDAYATAEDQKLTVDARGVLGNDTDVDGRALSAIAVAKPAHGTLTLAANGGFTYTPAANWSGTDSFSYRANDGKLSSPTVKVTLTVSAVNDAPVNVRPGAQTVRRNVALVFSAAHKTRLAVTDVDAGNAPIQVTITTTHGSLTLSRRTGLTFVRGDGSADTLMIVRGTMIAINAALDGAKYQPDKNFAGLGGLTMTSDDLGSTGAGGPLQDVDTVPIKVT